MNKLELIKFYNYIDRLVKKSFYKIFAESRFCDIEKITMCSELEDDVLSDCVLVTIRYGSETEPELTKTLNLELFLNESDDYNIGYMTSQIWNGDC